jgi:hypothetical protein
VKWDLFIETPVSPDGSVVILQDAQGVMKRWPIGGGDPLPIPGLQPNEAPIAFTADGKALFVAGRTFPIPVARLDLATGGRRPWLTLAPTDSSGLRFATVCITSDGKHWVLGVSKLLTDLYVVEGLR